MRQFLLLAAVLSSMGLGVSASAETLLDVCAQRARYVGQTPTNFADSGQFDSTCRAAYANGDAAIKDQNMTRVWTPVAVVCAYGCLGGGGSCAAGGGACSGAVNAGTKAHNANIDSGNEYTSAQGNGVYARDVRSASPVISDVLKRDAAKYANIDPATTDGAFGSPASCGRAGRTGALSDRMNCAAAADPSFPAFARTQQFAREFQDITGFPLQSVVNMSGDQVRNQVLPAALRNMYNKLSGKMSLAEFMSKASDMVKAVAKDMPDAERRKFLAQLLPGYRDPGPAGGEGGGATAIAQASGAGETAGSRDLASEISTGHGGQEGTYSGPPGSWSEDDRNVSLFERVSYRYRLHSPGMGGG